MPLTCPVPFSVPFPVPVPFSISFPSLAPAPVPVPAPAPAPFPSLPFPVPFLFPFPFVPLSKEKLEEIQSSYHVQVQLGEDSFRRKRVIEHTLLQVRLPNPYIAPI